MTPPDSSERNTSEEHRFCGASQRRPMGAARKLKSDE